MKNLSIQLFLLCLLVITATSSAFAADFRYGDTFKANVVLQPATWMKNVYIQRGNIVSSGEIEGKDASCALMGNNGTSQFADIVSGTELGIGRYRVVESSNVVLIDLVSIDLSKTYQLMCNPGAAALSTLSAARIQEVLGKAIAINQK